ncbi:MAG: thiolase family protein [Desulfobacterales bacterium]|jgi:acetyl-CoA acyltransferase|nr:thiolase family protein [Desulfobacterales bacterium]
MRDAYIVTSVRTPGCKQVKGAFKDTRPEDLLSFILSAVVEKAAGPALADVEDIMVGCAFPEAEQGMNIGRLAAQIAGFPNQVSGATVNRFCASGLEAIALAALRVMAGWSDIVIGGGIESMSYIPIGGLAPRPHPEFSQKRADLYMSMGLTAENVAKRYGISREAQDAFAYESQMKAAHAQQNHLFTELIPTPATRFTATETGPFKKETVLQSVDDGVRADTTRERLAALKPAFASGGTVTAGNASQMTDGAAATLMMSEAKVTQFGLKPIATLKGYTTIGCNPDEMGVGPRYAIPKLLDQVGLKIEDIGLFEINEAFASQALYCIRELGIDSAKVNLHGGAIALGHPLGCTGAKLCATLLSNMKQKGVKYGVESMCIGMGMGAAALFELCE